ncbi:MAG: SiaB family protein kinase [Bacteroidales bacterium]|nr:SiaB family protein kinase [Bacteroidales bacterium]
MLNDLSFAFQLFEGMEKDNLSYIYRGLFTQGVTDKIISLTETNLANFGESSKMKKRVFSIMVEGLQNITRHQDVLSQDEKSGIFVIQQKKNRYYITTGNPIAKDHIPKLTGQLDKINSLEKEELKKFYKSVLNDNMMSNKGGAGLGLIEMARKSGNKLTYDFKKIDDEFSYFYLYTEISVSQNTEDKDVIYSLTNIKQLHNILNKENVLLIFNGLLNQDNLINLLSIIEEHMAHALLLKKRVFNIMVEMLQNIVKHGDSFETDKGNSGIFFINKKGNSYFLNSGNYINNKKVDNLKLKIEHVNSLDDKKLNKFYNDRLFNFQIDSSKEAGLGLIELRLKSKNKIVYNFYKINDKFSFFTIRTCIEYNA